MIVSSESICASLRRSGDLSFQEITLLLKLALAAVLSIGMCAADTVIGTGAGAVPGSAKDFSGDNSLTGIVGAISDPYGVNLFEINITNYLDFSAVTLPIGAFGIPDTELFLFYASGHGLYGNDDISGGNTFSCLPSATSGNPCGYGRNGLGPTSDGLYYLAITRSANGPLSNSGEIFTTPQSGSVAGPDLAAGGADVLSGWDNGVFTSPDFDLTGYQIALTGTAPEPATWWLMGAAGSALLLLRRKRASN
jgi:hypothetical protein